MLTLHYDESLKTNETYENLVASTSQYTQRLRTIVDTGTYTEPESSINLPSDQEMLAKVQELVETVKSDALRYHVVVGIGGSNLGTKAVYDALYGYADTLQPARFPKLLFAETTSPDWLRMFTELATKLESTDQIIVSVISKSGGTTETLANFEIIVQALATRFGSMDSVLPRVVAITDEGSALWEQAGELNLHRLPLQLPVGGRYSVLSAVGLFPLATIGCDILALRKGATDIRQANLSDDANLSVQSAAVLAYYHTQAAVISDNFFFNPQLESLGKWYRQLMGESVGKQDSLTGETIHAGITPTVSLGSTDLHSVGQLYLGGPKDKITTFVYTNQHTAIGIPEEDERVLPQLVPIINGRQASDIMQAIFEGVQVAYKNASLPYMTLLMDTIDEYNLGAYLQFKMMEMMYLGQMMHVNSFDQPNVELYKIETKRILTGTSS